MHELLSTIEIDDRKTSMSKGNAVLLP